jgi:hypothetical protein
LAATNAQVASSLGRDLAACRNIVPCSATTATNAVFVGAALVAGTQLFEPNTRFEDRLNQLDIRFSKTLKLGRARLQGQFDIYNPLNANDALVVNTRLGPSFLQPSNVLGARLFKLGAQLDF